MGLSVGRGGFQGREDCSQVLREIHEGNSEAKKIEAVLVGNMATGL